MLWMEWVEQKKVYFMTHHRRTKILGYHIHHPWNSRRGRWPWDIETVRDSLKLIADMIRTKLHIPTNVQMVMDLCQRLFLGNYSNLKPFDDVLHWAFNHSLICDHVPRTKPMLKQVSKAVCGKEFLKLSRPKQHRAPLCMGHVAEVTIFDIRTILLDLLCNDDFIKGNT